MPVLPTSLVGVKAALAANCAAAPSLADCVAANDARVLVVVPAAAANVTTPAGMTDWPLDVLSSKTANEKRDVDAEGGDADDNDNDNDNTITVTESVHLIDENGNIIDGDVEGMPAEGMPQAAQVEDAFNEMDGDYEYMLEDGDTTYTDSDIYSGPSYKTPAGAPAAAPADTIRKLPVKVAPFSAHPRPKAITAPAPPPPPPTMADLPKFRSGRLKQAGAFGPGGVPATTTEGDDDDDSEFYPDKGPVPPDGRHHRQNKSEMKKLRKGKDKEAYKKLQADRKAYMDKKAAAAAAAAAAAQAAAAGGH